MSSKIASDLKYHSDYSQYIDTENRAENWDDSVDRIMDMHLVKYEDKMTPELEKLMSFVSKSYKVRELLGSQRALQFGGDPILQHHSKIYNCLSSFADRNAFFQEAMYWLLSGCGIGFSVQYCHNDLIPNIQLRTKGVKTFTPEDSIEGWADCFGVLSSSYTVDDPTFKEYQGYRIDFDLSKIRPKGAKISGGFKAPGPDGLRESLQKCQELLDNAVRDGEAKFRPILVYDFVMHMSDAVLSGGVRRSATICIFSPTDTEMLNAKTGNWFTDNPQRGRSNNSVALVRSKTTREDFERIYKSVKEFGEPGFLFTDHEDFLYNPCVEIGMYPRTEDGRSGWQGCNLTEGNGVMCTTPEAFYRICKASAIMGTLQAGYTDFKYVAKESREIFEREALIGCSFTGWTNNPDVMFTPEVQRKGAEIVKKWNKIVADLIGINQAARTTCTKPSGNASVILGRDFPCASGIHGEHAPRYFRHMQMNKDDDVAQLFAEFNPEAVEDSVWSASGTDWVFAIPVVAKPDSLFKKDLIGVKQLELVKLTQQNWVESGTNVDLCVKPTVRHNVSNTIQVEDWEEVKDYLWENRHSFAGVSLLSVSGDKDYKQAPFVEVFTSQQLLDKYGDASLLASGLIMDGLHAFNNDLWDAVDAVMGLGDFSEESHVNLLKKDWIRRAKQFSSRYMNDDLKLTGYCLKDVYNLHKWLKVTRDLVDIDWTKADLKPKYTAVDTLGSVACASGTCELPDWLVNPSIK